MLDSLLDSVKGQVVSAIAEKTGLNADQATQAIPLAGESITEGITGALAGGNVDGILGMFKSAVGGGGGGGLVENMVYKGIAGSFINKATSALGLNEGVAGTISGIALPLIMNKIGGAAQAQGDTDDIDQSSLMGALGLDAGSLLSGLAGGGAAGSVLGKAADLLGGDDDKKDDGGGLLGKIGGMFK